MNFDNDKLSSDGIDPTAHRDRGIIISHMVKKKKKIIPHDCEPQQFPSNNDHVTSFFLPRSLESARNQRKPSVQAIQKKGDELREQIRAQGTIPVSFEHNLKTFSERWDNASKLIDEKKLKVILASRDGEIVDMSARVENTLKDTERFVDSLEIRPMMSMRLSYSLTNQGERLMFVFLLLFFLFSLPPLFLFFFHFFIYSYIHFLPLFIDEYYVLIYFQSQSKLDDLFSNERHLIKLRDLAKNLSKEDRQTPIFQLSVKRLDDRWTNVASKIEDRKRQLSSTLESGPPKEYLTTMDTVLMSIKNAESSLGGNSSSLKSAHLKTRFKDLRLVFVSKQRVTKG